MCVAVELNAAGAGEMCEVSHSACMLVCVRHDLWAVANEITRISAGSLNMT